LARSTPTRAARSYPDRAQQARTAISEFVSGRGKSLAYVGTALAVTGIGTATAATAAAPASAATVSTVRQLSAGDFAGIQQGPTIAFDRPAAPAKATSQHARHARHASRVHVVRHSAHAMSWRQIRDALAKQTFPRGAPGKLPLADRLLPGSASGAQSALPITSSRLANATTIVRQALAKHMGIRSAVIAVATSMQESGLENINFGDRDSLGLFQQRPSCGWGSAAQLTNPAYAADAFLRALHTQQKSDPDWAGQPLWQVAQSVQNSGFPYAYAKWEAQAAQLVSHISTQLVKVQA
jgi:hypothetical protein